RLELEGAAIEIERAAVLLRALEDVARLHELGDPAGARERGPAADLPEDRGGLARVQRERLVVGGEGLAEAADVGEAVAAVGPGGDAAAIEAQRAVVAGDRLLGPPRLIEHRA